MNFTFIFIKPIDFMVIMKGFVPKLTLVFLLGMLSLGAAFLYIMQADAASADTLVDFKVVDVSGNVVRIMNTGSSELKEVRFYADGKFITFAPVGSIKPGETKTFILDEKEFAEPIKKLKIVADGNISKTVEIVPAAGDTETVQKKQPEHIDAGSPMPSPSSVSSGSGGNSGSSGGGSS